jgi:hypothetical protein
VRKFTSKSAKYEYVIEMQSWGKIAIYSKEVLLNPVILRLCLFPAAYPFCSLGQEFMTN